MLAAFIPAAFALGKAGLEYYNASKNKPAPFENTDEAKYLANVRENGVIAPGERRGLLGRAGAVAGNQASQRKADIRGGLISRGMGNSISGARLLDTPGRDTQRTLTNTGVNLDIMNEQSKNTAAQQYATKSTNRDDMRTQYSKQMTSGLIGGLTGAGASAYGAYANNTAIEAAKPKGIDFPANFATMSATDRYSFGVENGIPYADLEDLWYESILEQHKTQGGTQQTPGAGIMPLGGG